MNRMVRLAVCLTACLAASYAMAEDFSGGYVGSGLGLNRSDTSSPLVTPADDASSYGFQGGYGWNVGSTLLGVRGYVDSGQQVTRAAGIDYSSDAYGLGLKVGVPIDSLMPYASLGYDRTQGAGYFSGIGADSTSGGLGLVYKFAPSWSVEGEVSTTSSTMNGLKFRADNFNFGLNHHFDLGSITTGSQAKKK